MTNLKRIFTFVGMAIATIVILGFGMDTYRPLQPDDIVLLSDLGEVDGSDAVQHVATIPCIADNVAAALYVKDLEELKSSASDVRLIGDAEAISYSRAKELIKESKNSVAFDPTCVRGRYFEPKKRKLIWTFLGKD